MSSPASPARERRILLGILFICLSGALFARRRPAVAAG
jgi:hypothetical protein